MKMVEAVDSDIQFCVSLGMRMYEEAEHWHKLRFDPTQAARAISAAIHEKDQCMWIITTDDDAVVGFFACALHRMPFTSDLTAHETIMYVVPEYRGRGAIVHIIKTFTDWAADNKARMVVSNIAAGIGDKVVPLMERMGFTHVGGLVCKEV